MCCEYRVLPLCTALDSCTDQTASATVQCQRDYRYIIIQMKYMALGQNLLEDNVRNTGNSAWATSTQRHMFKLMVATVQL